MSALFKNRDLLPDAMGTVSMQQTYEAMLRVGIAERVAHETSIHNFMSAACPTCPSRVNLFEMNTITTRRGTSSPPGLPHEHFRSTGIRDGMRPQGGAFGFGETQCHLSPTVTLAKNLCFAALWDCEGSCSASQELTSVGKSSHVPSNDVDVSKRPRQGTSVPDGQTTRTLTAVCAPNDSGETKCPSQLHGAIGFMFQEFGTPTGTNAEMPSHEYANLWLQAEYPAAFAARSPRSCVREGVSTRHLGCDNCFTQINAGVSTTAERYVRCVRSKLDNPVLGLSVNDAPAEFREMVGARASRRRQLNQDVIVNGVNLTATITDWAEQAIAAHNGCEPFCAATGTFMGGLGATFLAAFELSLVRPPAFPPNAPMLPPLPPFSPGEFVEQFNVVITLSSSMDIQQVDDAQLDSLATSFARAANVPRSAVTVSVRAGSVLFDFVVATNAESQGQAYTEMIHISSMVSNETQVRNNSAILFGIPLNDQPSTSLAVRRVPLPAPPPTPPPPSLPPLSALHDQTLLFGLLLGGGAVLFILTGCVYCSYSHKNAWLHKMWRSSNGSQPIISVHGRSDHAGNGKITTDNL